MTERVWGVIGPEYVFEQSPFEIKADAWARYGGTETMPIKGRKAYKEGGRLYWADGSPVTLVEEPADPS